MRLIAINGAKYTPKTLVALKLANNSDCVWVHPYTDLNITQEDEYVHLSQEKLSRKMEREIPLAVTEVNGHRYVFFENQFRGGFCVIIADDRVISYLKEKWDDELVTVKLHCKKEVKSNRCLLPDDEYDIIFNTDTGDYDELSELVSDIFLTNGD